MTDPSTDPTPEPEVAAQHAGQTLFVLARKGSYNDKRGPRFCAALALAMLAVRTREVIVLEALLVKTWDALREGQPITLTADDLHRAMQTSFEAAIEELKRGPRIELPGQASS